MSVSPPVADPPVIGRCHHFDAGRCRSCEWLGAPYDAQLVAKQRHVEGLLGGPDALEWGPPVSSSPLSFRNKAKMVVSGRVDALVLGILDPSRGIEDGVDLQDCPLHLPGIRAALPLLAGFVARARLEPYDVGTRRGELKHLLVTESPDGELMVRFVLRSQESVSRIRKHLPGLQAELPQLAVASVNLQPEHKAILEGERELILTERETLPMRLSDDRSDGALDLHLRPQSFFQTNTSMAIELYRRGREWIDETLAVGAVWDLYCGVGGFALHLAAPGRSVVGLEISTEAVASAQQSAEEAGLANVRFVAGDATTYALESAPADRPDLVVVNPPRRGIGPELSDWLEESGVPHVLYSSCNATTLTRDLAAMPSLVPVRAQLLDMFPNTAHYEVLTLLRRR